MYIINNIKIIERIKLQALISLIISIAISVLFINCELSANEKDKKQLDSSKTNLDTTDLFIVTPLPFGHMDIQDIFIMFQSIEQEDAEELKGSEYLCSWNFPNAQSITIESSNNNELITFGIDDEIIFQKLPTQFSNQGSAIFEVGSYQIEIEFKDSISIRSFTLDSIIQTQPDIRNPYQFKENTFSLPTVVKKLGALGALLLGNKELRDKLLNESYILTLYEPAGKSLSEE